MSLLYLSYVVDSLAVPNEEQTRRSCHAARSGELVSSDIMMNVVRIMEGSPGF
jgi:hypothetical protein